MSTVFVGHFSPADSRLGAAASPAGNQVQRRILKELVNLAEEDVYCFSMEPAPFWPRGRLLQRTKKEDSITFIGYVNLPAVKHLSFSLRLFLELFRRRAKLCLQYNSYLFENCACLAYRVASACRLVIFIQDVHISNQRRLSLKKWVAFVFEATALNLSKLYDVVVPVSSDIIADFHFDPSKCCVFQGGITDFAEALMRDTGRKLEPIGVFAGALEPYNGIDQLVDQWLRSGVEYKLHIFGRGSLSSYISSAAAQCKSIVYHGFQSEDVVIEWQRVAMWNFCLRYSSEINQKYFFPSKLFNLLCSPGTVVANNFSHLPASLRQFLVLLRDDLSDLKDGLEQARSHISEETIRERRELALSAHSWGACLRQLLNRDTGSREVA